MNRVIKFRVWDKRTEQMFGNEVLLESGRQLVIFAKRMKPDLPDMQNAHGGLLLPIDDENLVFMQFAGLHDRNGVEIYEGDIVDRTHYLVGKPRRVIGQVVFIAPRFFVDGVGKYKRMVQIDLDSSYEVIGNIYEHPELLGTPTE